MMILLGFVFNILGLFIAHRFVDGFSVIGNWRAYLIAGVVFTLLNWIVKPILKIITGPLIFISLGLFLIVINAIIVWLTAELTGYVVIENYVALLLATLIIVAVNVATRPFK